MEVSRSPRDRIWSRREVEGLISDGRKIIILDNQVIKADAWMKFHPGGEKAILHMVGRDGTDEIRALHSPEAQAHMQKFVIGKVEGRWENFLPPIQGGHFRPYAGQEEVTQENTILEENSSRSSSTAPPSPIFDPVETRAGLRQRRETDTNSISSTSSLPSNPVDDKIAADLASDLLKFPPLDYESQDAIVAKYRALEAELREAGLFNCRYWCYGVECIRYLALFVGFLVCLQTGYYGFSGLFLGLLWHQLVFTVHDAGHMGITHNFHIDTSIGIIIADFIGGLSVGWWKRNHNVHHIVTNSPEHDPDIEHLPFFAISTRLFKSLRSSYYDRVMEFDTFAKWAISKQHWLYYPILALGRFNLYRLTWEYLLLGQAPRKGPAWWHRYFEIAGQFFFWTWYGYGVVYCCIPTAWDRFMFVLISHVVTGPLHVQITLSHFSMSTADLGIHESFPQKMLRTTMDVDCPTWLDFFHGGLQFQAIHHLFPRMPRHNLRLARPYVQKFCAEMGIPYTIYGFIEGNKDVISHLGQIAKQVKIYEECRKSVAKDIIQEVSHAH